jgi:hypothetical protein
MQLRLGGLGVNLPNGFPAPVPGKISAGTAADNPYFIGSL